MKNTLLLLVLTLLLAPTANAQVEGLAGQRRPLTVQITPMYQHFSDDVNTVTEVSSSVLVAAPVGRRMGLSLRTAGAQATGDGLPDVSGLGDVQVGGSYYLPVGGGSLVAHVGLSLPSGKQQLSADEFQTLAVLSRNVFDFQVPSFGQGLGVAPGVTLALPLGEAFVLGAGASFQYRGTFEPLADMPTPYDPGDEMLLTLGFDTRLGPAATLSGDVSYTSYQADALGDDEVFGAGDKVVTSVQYRVRRGFNALTVRARYRSRAKNSLAVAGALVEEDAKTSPNQLEVTGRYDHRLNATLSAALGATLRSVEATPLYDAVTVVGVSVAPTLRLSRSLLVPVRAAAYFGGMSGYEAGLGLVIQR